MVNCMAALGRVDEPEDIGGVLHSYALLKRDG